MEEERRGGIQGGKEGGGGRKIIIEGKREGESKNKLRTWRAGGVEGERGRREGGRNRRGGRGS